MNLSLGPMQEPESIIYFPGISDNATKNIEFEFFAISPDISDENNVSIKCVNHVTDIQVDAEDLSFSGCDCAWHRNQVNSKVEFYHNEHGNKKSFDLPKAIPDNNFEGYRHRWQTAKGKKEKVLKAWIKYLDVGDWIHVIKNRKWTGWNESGGPSGRKDSEGVKN